MKKIVIFTGTLSHGGSERVISTLCNEFVNVFDKVEIILFYNMSIFYNMPENITITTIDSEIDGKVNIVKKLLWLRKYITKNN